MGASKSGIFQLEFVKDYTIQFPGNDLGIESNAANEKVRQFIHKENEVVKDGR